jgi:hypothetical protein
VPSDGESLNGVGQVSLKEQKRFCGLYKNLK